ncbi:MAG: ATP-binding protein [Planctomycetota bacterium]
MPAKPAPQAVWGTADWAVGETSLYARHLEEALLRALRDSPVVFLRGARQVGKTTLAQRVGRGIAGYRTFDDLKELDSAREDPQGFVARLDTPVVLDEIQRCPEIFLPLKASVDRDRRPGRFLLTGSAGALVLPRLADAMVGRMQILTLHPLSQGEIDVTREGFIDALFSADMRWSGTPTDVWSRMGAGGFPEAIRLDARSRASWFDSHVDAVVSRDVREMSDIEGLTVLPRLVQLAAARIGSLLNHSELARAMALPQTTLKRYLALLESTFLVFRLRPWSPNLGKRLVRSAKLYFTDVGLAAHLLNLDAEALKARASAAGPLLENFVVAEIMRQLTWSRTRAQPYHFRTHDGHEVDIVLEGPAGRCVAVEVKATGTPRAADFHGLGRLKEALGDRFVRGVLLHLGSGSHALPFGERLEALPVSALWQCPAK